MNSYLDHFKVSVELMQKVIGEAMSGGGNYADLFFEHSISNSIGLEDGIVNQASSNIDYGVGIRVLKGNQTGYAYSETIDASSMLNAARMSAKIADTPKKFHLNNMKIGKSADYYKISSKWENISVKDKLPFVQKLNDTIFSLDKKVTKVSVFLGDETKYTMFYNSEGRLTFDYQPLVEFYVVCIMQQGNKIENASSSSSFRKGFEWLSEELINTVAKDVINKTNILFKAIKPKAGEMPVVLASGSSGILLHEAIGHAFEADFNRKDISIFSDKMGEKVAKSFINIVDDGTIENNRGAINMDDEGNEVKKTYLVKDGVLNSFIHDRISAKHYKVEPTGNGRRQSFRHAPLPRMRSTYMEPGPHTPEEILQNVKHGIFVDNFSNGQVKIGEGDFTFYVKSGYLIENGKLTQPVKDINIIGNGPQTLADISMVADDFQIDNGMWTCGKEGQSVPVSLGLPTVLVKKLTVGGASS